MGLFDGVKRSIVQPVSTKAYIPVVERKSAQVLSISGTTAQMMDMKDFTNFEIEIPPEKQGDVEAGKEADVHRVHGQAQARLSRPPSFRRRKFDMDRGVSERVCPRSRVTASPTHSPVTTTPDT